MACRVNVSEAILEKTDLESGLEKVFTCVLYAVFGCDSADIHIGGVKQFKDLSQRLLGRVHSFKSGVLLYGLVASLVECQFLACIWKEFFVDAASSSTCYAMRRPNAAVLLERRMVGRVMVADKKDREGVEYLVLLTFLAFCL